MTRFLQSYGIVSLDVARDPTISTGAKALYLVLTTYTDGAGDTEVPDAELKADLGCTQRNLQMWLDELTSREVLYTEDEEDGTRCIYLDDGTHAEGGTG